MNSTGMISREPRRGLSGRLSAHARVRSRGWAAFKLWLGRLFRHRFGRRGAAAPFSTVPEWKGRGRVMEAKKRGFLRVWKGWKDG